MSEMNLVVGPAITAAIVFAYEYFQNKHLPIMSHVKVAGLSAGCSAASNLLFKSVELPFEFILQPGVSGVAFAFGKKQFLGTRNTLYIDISEGAVGDLVGSFAGKSFSKF